MLAQLHGLTEAMRLPVAGTSRPQEEMPRGDGSDLEQTLPAIPLAQPVEDLEALPAIPLAEPVHPLEAQSEIPLAQPADPWETELEVPLAHPIDYLEVEPVVPLAQPVTEPADQVAEPALPEEEPTAADGGMSEVAVESPPKIAAVPRLCPICQAPRRDNQGFCEDCGLVFPVDAEAPPQSPRVEPVPNVRLKGRYELGQLLGQRGEVSRYRALDFGVCEASPVPVVVLRAPATEKPEAVPAADIIAPVEGVADEDVLLPSFDDPVAVAQPITERLPDLPPWPSLAWEQGLRERAIHPSLPAILDSFVEENSGYLVEEVPAGQALWDAWDNPEATAEQRFGWLKQIVEAVHQIHQAGAMFESLRPETMVVTSYGQARLSDLGELLPLPLPAHLQVRGSLYTAPELVLDLDQADARADIYHFGALMYALHVGRELAETDFERPGTPKDFIPQFPDIHPLFGRLLSKTFCRDVDARFPTDDAAKDDPTGFTDLMDNLEACGRALDNVRLEIAAWTTTGMVRTGNEDAFALLHSIESNQNDLGESALVLLADGMGGSEAGEVAARIAVQSLRRSLLKHKAFAQLAGYRATDQSPFNLEDYQELLRAALKDANLEVYQAARSGVGRRGMGCTAEVVYINGRNVVVGHVGDSRTYHWHEGRLIQMTRDQTLVNRLLELGTLTPEEAAIHPRRSELQQAIGGRGEVEPALYHCRLKAQDWVVVCSDGLSNHISPQELQQMLQTEATSAEMAARRLVNFVNIKGATDNATVVVIRAT
jgi:serine/threonine protein phosphatase PrpC